MADATPRASLPNMVEWRKFLTDYPPGTRASVEGAVAKDGSRRVATPELQLFCDGSCQRPMYSAGAVRMQGLLFPHTETQLQDAILAYTCQKCQSPLKTYAIRVLGDETRLNYPSVDAAKLGEWPPFTFQTPSKVMTLVGPDREFFFKGRKAETEGLGVGAFAYYRRIVEGQKNRLLSEMIRVARRINAPATVISQLEAAQKETQFSKAVDQIKDSLPQSLLLNGQNPLKLLHAALSRNLHGASDDECLQVASAVRIILFELVESMANALKEKRELDEAVARLANPAT